jgi:hypothetical protein
MMSCVILLASTTACCLLFEMMTPTIAIPSCVATVVAAALQFALEVVKACVDAIGADRVSIRLSPFTDFLDATDSTPYATFM